MLRYWLEVRKQGTPFTATLVFIGILAGCLAMLLLVILMVRFPLVLMALVLACWIFSRMQRD